jgi:hypothetical protein
MNTVRMPSRLDPLLGSSLAPSYGSGAHKALPRLGWSLHVSQFGPASLAL